MYIEKIKIDQIFEQIGVSPKYYEHRNQLTAHVPTNNLVEFFNLLKHNDETYFDMCVDITAIDWLRNVNRFEIVYILFSTKFDHYLHVKTEIDEKKPHCPSATSVWESANWYERETYDMYGIIFDNHPFLRRFYMPEDFRDPETKEPIYPLRKDVPLMGVPDALPLPSYPEKYGELQ
jgi:NADH-quinone oxidoreductase subunit C